MTSVSSSPTDSGTVDGPQPVFTESSRLQARLHDLVPGGAHTYARGSDQYPERMTPIVERGRGARVWDVDGNEYVEYGMGLRSVTLGHAYEPVNAAVRDVLDRGLSFSRPSRLEVEAAEDFLGLVSGADMVKFAKNGSDATTAALKLARAATGRETVAVADQPFFSTDDWFIGNTPMNAGIPDAVRTGTVGFTYNDLGSLRALFDAHPGRIAAVFMEAATALHDPAPGFLEGVREMCTAEGTVLVFDEMITGFRWSASGAQAVYGVTPDLSTWGKAMGNGFPVSALAGRRELMELGGLRTDAERVFLLSTTHGPETAGLTAFRAVVEAYRREDPVAVMHQQGTKLAEAANEVVAAAGLTEFVDVVGHPACLVFRTRDASGRPSQEMRTVFLAELLRRGVLGQSFVISAAHTDADVEQTVAAVAGALPAYEKALTDGPGTVLDGRPVAPALRATAAPEATAVTAAGGRWLVTGGAGYIGAHTVRALRARGDEVVVLDDLSTGLPERVDDDVALVRASVLDEDTVAATLTDHRLDGVLHFAARKSVPESVERPLYYWHENVEGLRSVLAACGRAGVERVVYSSSAAVYGATTGAAVAESDPCAPVNPYGTTKLAGEWLLADVHRATGLRYVALRYFNVAGARDARLADRGQANLVPIALDAVARGGAPTVFGTDYDTPDGSCVRDFVHVDDLADAHVAATALLDGPCAETLNVGVGRGFSVLEVMATVGRVAGRPVDPVIAPRRAGDPAAVVADVSRIAGRLGWSARHDLDDIVTSAWEARVSSSARGS